LHKLGFAMTLFWIFWNLILKIMILLSIWVMSLLH